MSWAELDQRQRRWVFTTLAASMLVSCVLLIRGAYSAVLEGRTFSFRPPGP